MNCANCSASLRRKKLTSLRYLSLLLLCCVLFDSFLTRHIVLIRGSMASPFYFVLFLFVFALSFKVNKSCLIKSYTNLRVFVNLIEVISYSNATI